MEQTRRDFLKGAGLVAGIGALAGASSLAGCASGESAKNAGLEERYDCDVVIAGAGIGGLAAAVSAAEQGANVVLVEASKHVGGTSRFAAGALGPRFGTDWEEVLKKAPLSDPVLGKVVTDKWPEYLEWITGLGLTTEPLSDARAKVQSPYVWMGGRRPAEQGSKSFTDEYLQQFGEIYTNLGGQTLLQTRATKIITDDAGAAIGIVAEDANGPFAIKAKAVILATGGWQCDKEMCTKYLGRHADVSQAQCVPYLDGAGIKMGVEVGAQLSRSFGSFYGHPQPWPMTYMGGIDTPEGYEAVENVDDVHLKFYGTTQHAVQLVGVYVNTDGKRFVNEGLTSSTVNQEIMQQYMARAYLIVDAGLRAVIGKTPFFNAAIIGGDRFENMEKMGVMLVEANSLEELAAKIATDTPDGAIFNQAAFLKTMAEYNEAAAAGTADKMDVPHTGMLPAIPIVKPPFYALPVVPGIMTTFGGLKINADTQVIGTNDRPIAGLYAVPATAGGIMNADYWCVMSGYSVFGRIAGANTAAYAASKAEPAKK